MINQFLAAIALKCAMVTTETNLNVSGTEKDWENVLYVIEKSNAEYPRVIQAKDFIIPQLIKQIDTTKNK